MEVGKGLQQVLFLTRIASVAATACIGHLIGLPSKVGQTKYRSLSATAVSS
jgi:hypothetical protein